MKPSKNFLVTFQTLDRANKGLLLVFMLGVVAMCAGPVFPGFSGLGLFGFGLACSCCAWWAVDE